MCTAHIQSEEQLSETRSQEEAANTQPDKKRALKTTEQQKTYVTKTTVIEI